ncbi:DUF1007 family protein [Otariodibacter oris]|uniref:ABC-type uncharacterized transport system substrate-binding protein n=1 Tax=Otariodibacter oris TaxID=1032623 RepID=A0A420XJC7_9PAST|nr:DUF1007 family protein [Otariodibacter oris]QGM80641.1 hypothetical protein A6A10_04100 [Otariodibacter oris]RKR77200.1 ABC-type uncharacterized transport system substrate-binding protein [Otariodibacter oris]
MKKYALIILLSYLFFTENLLAHPHTFIDMKNKVLVEDNKLRGFDMSWRLDEITSSQLIYELKNAEDKQRAEQDIIGELSLYIMGNQFFSRLYNEKDKRIQFDELPISPSIKIEDSRITYDFELPLLNPVETKGHTFKLFTFEPTYYLSMSYLDHRDITIDPESQCTVSITESKVDESLRLYASQLDQAATPDMSSISQFKKSDSDLPSDIEYSLGSRFAQRANIDCN